MNRRLDAFDVLGQWPSGVAALCGLAILLGMFTLRPLTAAAPVEAPVQAPVDAAASKAGVPAELHIYEVMSRTEDGEDLLLNCRFIRSECRAI